MSKTSGGCLGGMLIFGMFMPGLGLLLFGIVLMAWVGKAVGENDKLLTAYVVVGVVAVYVIPVAVFAWNGFASRSFKGFLGWMAALACFFLAASILFAVPSSFVAGAACAAGKEQRAVWSMRIIPVVWLAGAVAPPGVTCVRGRVN